MDGWGFLDCILLGMMIEYGGSFGLVRMSIIFCIRGHRQHLQVELLE